MKVSYTADAFSALVQLVNYIEATNTEGAGFRWRCIYYNEWVIAFSVHENTILIEALLHKLRISD